MGRRSNQPKPGAAPREADARETLQRALEDLLDATRARRGYRPRVFAARIRAQAALRRAEPPENRPAASEGTWVESG